jgi:hypothetical protein
MAVKTSNLTLYVGLVLKKIRGKNVEVFLAFLTLEDGTDTLSRNVGKGIPLDAA